MEALTAVFDFIWNYWFSFVIFLLVFGACRRLDVQEQQIRVLATTMLRRSALSHEERRELERLIEPKKK